MTVLMLSVVSIAIVLILIAVFKLWNREVASDRGQNVFGSGNLDELLIGNAHLLPDDIRWAMHDGHSVRFEVSAIVGPQVHQHVTT